MPVTQKTDGRQARSQRSRAAVADALIELFGRGELRPTAARIAECAGVSLRSVHHHFKDREALFEAAATRQNEITNAIVSSLDVGAPYEGRLEQFVAERSKLLETITAVRRAASLEAPFSRAITNRLRAFRKVKRDQALHVFEAELSASDPELRPVVSAAVCAAASWATWEELRANQRLSLTAARRAMRHCLDSLLRPLAGASQ
jgi:AcrR family transcriptional regulator